MGYYDDMDTSYMDNNTDWQTSAAGGVEQAAFPEWDQNMQQSAQQQDFSGMNTGWNYGPGNTEGWNQVGGTPVIGDGQAGGGYMQNGQFQDYSQLPGYQNQTQQNLTGIQNTLASIFNSKAGVSGLGAIVQGMQNKKKASMTNQLAQQMQPAMDPFGSQRAQYQQQLSSAYQDPYSQPIVRDQVAQIQRAQAIKDAAAGRRSNSSTSDPAMLAASAQVAQKYIDSLQTPAGANIGPQGLSSLLQLQQSGMNAGINGMASPIMSALGYNTGSNSNSQAMSNMQLTPQQQQALIKMLGTGGQ